jgi:O-antigen/teichoic acid export membrane protein
MRSLKSLLNVAQEPDEIGELRVRRAALTGITTLLMKGITLMAGLVSIPLTAKYLGQERFGLWLTLNMLITWIGVADLGLSNSLTNALATANGQGDTQKASLLVSTATWLMVGIAVAIAILCLVFYPLVAWDRVFNITSETAKAEIGPTVLIGLSFFVLRLPLSIPGRIYGAYQEGYFYQLWLGFSNLLSLVALIVVVNAQGGLPALLLAFLGALILGDVIAAVQLFGWHKRWLRPKLGVFDWQQSTWLLKTGLQFWIAQISAIAFLQTDLIIVARLFGASEVASYGVVLKLFTLIGAVQLSFLVPLWPAYCEASEVGDRKWIVQTLKRSILLSLLWTALAGGLLAYFSPRLVAQWVGQSAVPSFTLVVAMYSTSVITAIAQCIATLLNGLGQVKIQADCGLMAGAFNLIASIALGFYIGPSGVTWATALTILIFSIGWVGSKAKLYIESGLLPNSRTPLS